MRLFLQKCSSASNGNSCLISASSVQLLDTLGCGHHGIVRRARWNDLPVAVKVLRTRHVIDEFVQETNAMQQLSHPFLVRLYGVVLGDPLMMVRTVQSLTRRPSTLHTLVVQGH
jgi:serine/threonine protein kinase